ncbi:hypothetical protein [Candidatus Profftella armatura]|uniref:hypothetical protein n=1 Tax=Candidatus Profftella armatura TaxID=669502 RepID=UPI0015DC128B|nr:hypothetical protein [Candidatus Profftella armatura]QLK13872.1 hypothetical protein FK495_01495 [Candidatus Profftella armatura]
MKYTRGINRPYIFQRSGFYLTSSNTSKILGLEVSSIIIDKFYNAIEFKISDKYVHLYLVVVMQYIVSVLL